MKRILIFLYTFIFVNSYSQSIGISGNQAPANINGYDVTQYGITPINTSTANSTALNTLLNTTASSGSTIYFPPGSYGFSTGISVSDKYFHLVSNQATITIGSNNIQFLNITSTNATNGLGARWTIEGFVFTATTTGGAQVALYFSQYSGLYEVSNCTFNGFSNAGVETLQSQTASTTNPSSIGGTIIGCRFYKNYAGVYNYTSGEYVQIIGCTMLSNTIGISSIGGNETICGNVISYNVSGIDIGNGTNSGKCVISSNQITHNSSVSINVHEVPSTQGITINDNNIIYGTLRFANVTGVRVNGGLINADAYTFSTTVGCIFQGVNFSNSLANTISTTGNTPLYINCFKLNGDYATDGDNFTTVMPFKQSLCGSATLDFGNTATQTSAELTITVTGASDGDVVLVSPINASYNANSCYTARVSASNTVSVAFNNYSTGSIDPASGVFKVIVFKQ